MRSTLLKSVAVAAFAFAATAASAETITLKPQAGGVFGNVGAETVRTSETGSQVLNAGAFRVQDAADASRKFLAWCVDLANTLSLDPPEVYKTNAALLGETVTSNLQKLFNTAFAKLEEDNRVQAAGFQLAIWEIIEETGNSFDLEDGTFSVTHVSKDVLKAGQGFLDSLGDTPTGLYALTFWEPHPDATSSQALVTASPIPLPAAAWMLIAALAATAAATRARRSA